MTDLIVCSSCSRHVRRSESACPFCDREIAAAVANQPARAVPAQRLGRAALFTFAAASISAAGCGGSTDDGKNGSGLRDGGGDAKADGAGTGGNVSVPVYGAPIQTGGATGAGGATQGMGGGVAALYGAAPAPASK